MEKNQQIYTRTHVSKKRHGRDYSTSDQASNCRKYDCFYDYCDYFCLFVLFFRFWLLILNSFTSNVDCVVACARVKCVCVSVLFVRLRSSFCGGFCIFLCFKQLSHIHIEQMDESHSYDVVRQKYMLIWWMCCAYSEHCMLRIHMRLWFVDAKKRRSYSEWDLEVFRQIWSSCVCVFFLHVMSMCLLSILFLAFP